LDLLLVLGVVIAAAFLGGQLVQRLTLPSVTGYLLMGIILGPSVTGLIGRAELVALEPVTAFALGLIGLSIGGELRWRFLKEKWQNFGLLFLGESLGTLFLVTLSVYIVTQNLILSLILGVLSLAPAPTTILGVIREYKTQGPFPRVVMSLVALDNLWCVVALTVVTTVLNLYYFDVEPGQSVLRGVISEIGPAVGLAIILGAAGINIVNRARLHRKRQVLVTAILFIAVGLSRQMNISYLLVTLITGAMVVNFTPNYRRFFESLHTIDTPVLVIFLTLAGANLHLEALPTVGFLGVVYILARVAGKLLGSGIGHATCSLLPSGCSHIDPKHRKHIGLALTPQAGVAIGLSILAEQQLPLPEGVVVTLILGSVIFFQLVGPTLVVEALRRTDSIIEDES